MSGHARIAALAAVALLAAACVPSVALRTPPGFVEVEPTAELPYRATSAEGVVLGVRAQPNEPHGDLSFWDAAVEARLARRYGAAAASEVRTSSGYPGRQLRFTTTISGRPHR